jgi:hypothetical protein
LARQVMARKFSRTKPFALFPFRARILASATPNPVGEGAFLSASILEEALPKFGPLLCAVVGIADKLALYELFC